MEGPGPECRPPEVGVGRGGEEGQGGEEGEREAQELRKGRGSTAVLVAVPGVRVRLRRSPWTWCPGVDGWWLGDQGRGDGHSSALTAEGKQSEARGEGGQGEEMGAGPRGRAWGSGVERGGEGAPGPRGLCVLGLSLRGCNRPPGQGGLHPSCRPRGRMEENSASTGRSAREEGLWRNARLQDVKINGKSLRDFADI